MATGGSERGRAEEINFQAELDAVDGPKACHWWAS